MKRFIFLALAAAGMALAFGAHAQVVIDEPVTGTGMRLQGTLQLVKSDGESPRDEEGFTEFPESPDTRKIYVSASEGNDKNDGTAGAPVRSLSRGKQLVRDGYPDRLLLKRGDVWEDTFRNWKASGRGADEPMVVSSYGDGPRPLIQTGKKSGLRQVATPKRGEEPLRHVAFVGLHFVANEYDGTGNPSAVDIQGAAENLLFEDCRFEGYATNFSAHAWRGPTSNIRLRYCQILDAYSKDSHSQGMFFSEVDGIVIEHCLFDHNGWREGVADAGPTIFNHNAYIQRTTSGLVFRNNVSMRASSHGLQARTGGDVAGNIFYDNPLGILYGGLNDTPPEGVTGLCADNVVIGSSDIGDAPRGSGIAVVAPNPGSIIRDNLIVHANTVGKATALILNSKPGRGIRDVTVSGNVVYDHGTPLALNQSNFSGNRIARNVFQVTDVNAAIIQYRNTGIAPAFADYENNVYFAPAGSSLFVADDKSLSFDEWAEASQDNGSKFSQASFSDPGRTIAEYQESIGEPADVDAFIESLREQSARSYRAEYSTENIRKFFKAGF